MLVPFVLDPASLTEPAGSIEESDARHRRMLRLWTTMGVLVYSGPTFANSELDFAIQRLPQQERKLWQDAWRKSRRIVGPENWKGVEKINACEDLDILRGFAKVLVAGEICGAKVGIQPGEQSRIYCDIEIGRFKTCDMIGAFAQAELLADTDIEQGMLPEDVWKSRFQQLASFTNSVVLVDRFSGSNLLRFGKESGLFRLMSYISELKSGVELRVFTATQNKSDSRSGPADKPEDYVNALRGYSPIFAGSNLKRVHLHVLSDYVMGQITHGRWFRFGMSVCTVDIGDEVLAGDTVFRRAQFRMKPKSQEIEKTETRLRQQACQTHSIDLGSQSAAGA